MNLAEIIEQIAEAQLRTQNTLEQLAQAQLGTNESASRTHQSITELAAAVSRYVDSANTRMIQMEKNLDNLIRIITAEHSNGKEHK